MKDKHTVGGKMARNSRKIAILLLLFVLNQTICSNSDRLGTSLYLQSLTKIRQLTLYLVLRIYLDDATFFALQKINASANNGAKMMVSKNKLCAI